MPEAVEQNLEWLVIYLVYNNYWYDRDRQDTTEYYTMEEQTAYILNQIRHSRHSDKVKTIFVEAEINKTEQGTIRATLSMLYKKQGTWLSAVNGVWRDGTAVEVMTDAQSLQTTLAYLKNEFPAKKCMVITAGHGSITGINYYFPGMQPGTKRLDDPGLKALLERERNTLKDNQISKEIVAFNEADLFFLTNVEIGKSLQAVFGTRKLDVLVMYNCLMQNVFSQFEFSETVDWFVAPVSGIGIPGFNHGTILTELNTNPSADGEMVARLFIDSIRAGNRYTQFRDEIENTWLLSAVKLNHQKLLRVQEKFELLFKEVLRLSNERDGIYLIYCMSETIRYVFRYSRYSLNDVNLSDIGVFFALLKEKINEGYRPFSNLLPLIDELKAALHVPEKIFVFKGDNFYQQGGPFHYVDHDAAYQAHICHSGLLLPVISLQSKFLLDLCEETNYTAGPGRKETIPSLLSMSNYGMVIKKLMNVKRR